MSVTLRFQSSGAIPGNGQPVVMRGPSLTIGRGPENDLVLPDPDRQISKTHCVIENHNGNIVAVDLSTNGTFLNYGKIALGRTATPLNDGDVLTLGPYELVVSVAGQGAAEPLAPLADDRASHGNAAAAPDPLALLEDAGPGGDFLDSLLGTPKPKGPGQFRTAPEDFPDLLPPLGEDGPLLGPAAIGPAGPAMPDHGRTGSDAFRQAAAQRSVIPDDWEESFLAPPRPAAALRPAPTPAPPPIAQPVMIPEDAALAPDPGPAAAPFDPFATEAFAPIPSPPPAVTAPLSVPVAPVAMTAPVAVVAPRPDAARAFLKAVGAEDVRIEDADLPDTMARLGRTLAAMIAGLREILMTRTSIKSEFRIDQTMVNVGGNNPLKFSVSPEQAVEAMVKPASKGYLPAETAARQALDDIKAHEVAMVTGMEAALKGVLARLDPAALTTKIEAKGGFGSLLKSRKAQYWETYEAMYAEISDQAQNDFHELFSREFAAAYKDQLARLKQSQT